MNFHSDKWIQEQVYRHYQEALKLYPKERIVGVFLQGSQNYGLDYEGSDIDTKCILLPTWEDIVLNKKPVSTTHILDNEEHLDFKDIRLMFNCFRKQNVNFLEILFTKYYVLNPFYLNYWLLLQKRNEQIAHYNPVAAVRTMAGMTKEKYYALEHPYPSKIDIIEKYGYDPKQLHHMARMVEYIERYISGELYQNCLQSNQSTFLSNLKQYPIPLTSAREYAKYLLEKADNLYKDFTATHKDETNPLVDEFLNMILSNILEDYLRNEWKERRLYL